MVPKPLPIALKQSRREKERLIVFNGLRGSYHFRGNDPILSLWFIG
jgi:hypothetical protein